LECCRDVKRRPLGKRESLKMTTTRELHSTNEGETPSRTQELIARAEEQGYLTVDDLLELFPEAEEDLLELDELMARLQEDDIEVVTLDPERLAPSAQMGKGQVERELSAAPDVSDIDSHDSISLYLKQMASTPLLTRQEEVRLAKEMERGNIAEQRLELGVRDAVRRQQYMREVEAGRRARKHLIKANTRLVVSIAKRYRGFGVPFLDLIQEGNLGLMKAVQKFDHRRGCKFSTYATWWIRQSITRALGEQGRTIRLPTHVTDRIRKVYRAAQNLEQHGGDSPTPEEIAEQIGMSPARVRWLMEKSRRSISLEKPVGEEKDSEFGQFIEDKHSPAPDRIAESTLLADRMDEVLSTLTPRQERILRLRFGLESGRVYSLKEIAGMFGLTRERIRQIQREALRRLHHPSRSRKLHAFVG
jgi:RNA polymerase primary sigma factor